LFAAPVLENLLEERNVRSHSPLPL
jgi:hypothetical protein